MKLHIPLTDYPFSYRPRFAVSISDYEKFDWGVKFTLWVDNEKAMYIETNYTIYNDVYGYRNRGTGPIENHKRVMDWVSENIKGKDTHNGVFTLLLNHLLYIYLNELARIVKPVTNYTKVAFRKYPDDSIDALFPELLETDNMVVCYSNSDQHTLADYMGVISQTVVAKPEEYRALANELVSRGYNLLIMVPSLDLLTLLRDCPEVYYFVDGSYQRLEVNHDDKKFIVFNRRLYYCGRTIDINELVDKDRNKLLS